jgi:hypothetical protein
LRKRFSQDFSFDAHYTWSQAMTHSIGDLSTLDGPQDNNNLSIEKGPAPFGDSPHRFTADFLRASFASYLIRLVGVPNCCSAAGRLQESMQPKVEVPSLLRVARSNRRIDYVGGNVTMSKVVIG